MNKTTIRKLAYMLMEMESGGIPTDDQRLNYRTAKQYILSSVGWYLKQRLFEEKRFSEEHYTGNVVTKEVPVNYDSEGGYYYSDLLGESIDFGGMRSYNITDTHLNDRWTTEYVPVTQQQFFANRHLFKIPNVVLFYRSGDKIVFAGTGMENTDKVMLTQSHVIPTNDDDEIPVDIGNIVLQDAYRTVYPELTVQRDNINDGSPDTARQ